MYHTLQELEEDSTKIYLCVQCWSEDTRVKGTKGKRGKDDIEDLDLVSNKPNHLVDLTVTTISEDPYGSSEEDKSIIPTISEEDPHWLYLLGFNNY